MHSKQITKISNSFHGVLDRLHSLLGGKKQAPPPAAAAQEPRAGHSFWLILLGTAALTVLAYVAYTQYGAGAMAGVALPGSPAKGSSQPYPVAAEKVMSSVPSTTPDVRGKKKKSGGKA